MRGILAVFVIAIGALALGHYGGDAGREFIMAETGVDIGGGDQAAAKREATLLAELEAARRALATAPRVVEAEARLKVGDASYPSGKWVRREKLGPGRIFVEGIGATCAIVDMDVALRDGNVFREGIRVDADGAVDLTSLQQTANKGDQIIADKIEAVCEWDNGYEQSVQVAPLVIFII